jgi:molybdenum cofactor cytidylyltransferase
MAGTEPAHDAIVLAAGGSRRLGQPKQLLRRGGETLLHRSARLANESGAQRLIVVLGAQRTAMLPVLQGIECEVLENPDWEQGLASSLRLAVAHLGTTARRCLLLGCDQPALEAAHLRWLLAGAQQAGSGCAATRHDTSLGLPVVATPELLRSGATQRGDRGLRDALNVLPRASVAQLDAPPLCFDLDTPDDLREAQRRGWIDVHQ